MNLIAQAGEYSTDRSAYGFIILALAMLPLISFPLYVMYSPGLGQAGPAAAAFLVCSIALLAFLALFLKGRGMLFRLPIRAYDRGILMQPAMRIRPILVPYAEISSIEFWRGRQGGLHSGCELRSAAHGTIRSVESFRDDESLSAFISRIRPALEENGLLMSEPQGGFVFRKSREIAFP